ncbi:hypothetical protein [Lutibacter sp.]|uniref:hypothetical protein n=1 Tax=Lutibacter sp. TaxID=1925666 RepID=UPI0027367E5C|nr:hypothetical protein [Lutibacter sp.]MDP3312643.1 hypothetical protein [Lutibacter sp.]
MSIFSIFLLHQVVPHLHHHHEAEHIHKATFQVDKQNHDTHHHESPNKENSKNDLFDFFIEVHVHSIFSNEIIVRQKENLKQTIVENKVFQSVFLKNIVIYDYFRDIVNLKIYQPPNNYFNPYLLSLDSRGPPTLG